MHYKFLSKNKFSFTRPLYFNEASCIDVLDSEESVQMLWLTSLFKKRICKEKKRGYELVDEDQEADRKSTSSESTPYWFTVFLLAEPHIFLDSGSGSCLSWEI